MRLGGVRGAFVLQHKVTSYARDSYRLRFSLHPIGRDSALLTVFAIAPNMPSKGRAL